ncbi:unnamed protein product [Sphagnum troendelagicum]|uniref:DUF7748 domain-containing protein n=1 Tax=Sphagnum troendelagicum TaxID=128251 RepID=A0ABP0U1Q4_9BRYO
MGLNPTQIVNRTTKALTLKVGNHPIATIEKDGTHTISVDPNSTYQRFTLATSVDASGGAGKQMTVDSDQCVDNKCITISEVEGEFQVIKVPRHSQAVSESSSDTSAAATTKRQPGGGASWTSWLKN